MALVCISLVTVRPNLSASAENKTLRAKAPITSSIIGVCNASPMLKPGARLRRALSNSIAASVVEIDLSPALTALLPAPNDPDVISPMPHNAKPPAKKRRNAFIIGDLAPSRMDRNMMITLCHFMHKSEATIHSNSGKIQWLMAL